MILSSIKETAHWLSKNGKTAKMKYIAVNLKDTTVELSDKAIRKSNNKIIRKLTERRKGQQWNSVISEAFGGFICKSTVIFVLGKKAADNVVVDMYANNPHYSCSEPMHLYLKDKIDQLKKQQMEKRQTLVA